MQQVTLILIALIWLGGAWLRVYRQARYYQIEEYKSGRYLRWWLGKRERWLPLRPVIAAGIGAPLAWALLDVAGLLPAGIVAAAAALIAVWPPRRGEIKRPFRRTARATRLLAASFGVAIFDLALYSLIAGWIGVEPPGAQLAVMMLIGLLVFLTVPLILMSGNLLMTPFEALLRRRFMERARSILHEINPTVIGITGSYGKTTTKAFVAGLLNGRYKAYPTPKSYNTLMGISLAINNDLADDYSVDYFIVEMGAYVRGEIAAICDLTPPQIGIMVEVGPQHLERFGSLENTAAAKYELIKALPPDGVGVFNWDNSYVREMYERGYPAVRLAVSKTIAPEEVPEGGPRFVASEIEETLAGLRFTITDTHSSERARIETPVIGAHNVTNLLLAAAVAVHEGMSLSDVAFRARTLQPAESRLVRQTTPQGITIINDAYSANPAGAVSALQVLGLHTGGRRLLITPGMVELGPLHDQENHRLGELAAGYATDVILVGAEQTRAVAAGLRAADFPAERLQVVTTLSEAVDWYRQHLQPGDAVLFLNDLPDTY
jgi:UDP-N-acetylmuramoyl-tripeptide--D-alanyl-D-alanine ligase